MRHHVGVRLDRLDEVQPLELRHDALARLEPIEPIEPARERGVGDALHGVKRQLRQHHLGVGVEHRRHRQPVPLPHLEVIEVMRRRDLHRARALLRVGIRVRHHGDAPPDQRQDDMLADKVAEPLVLRVYGHRGVTEQRLGARRRHHEVTPRLALHRIAQVPQRPLHLPALDLEVADRGLEHRVPVHESPIPIHQPVPVEADEHLDHRLRQAGIHREALARPVEGRAEAPQLPADGPARLRLPVPDAGEERLPPHAAPVEALGRQQPLHHHLRRDAGMVGARLPQGIPALHPTPAHKDVLQRVIEGMPDMQAAGHVGRRDHDGEGRGGAVGARGERARCFPLRVDAAFEGGRVVGLVQHGASLCRPARRVKRRRRRVSRRSGERPSRSHSARPARRGPGDWRRATP